MRSHPRAPPARARSPLIGLLKTACLGLLPAFSWTQGVLPCPAETQTLTVANTNDSATLASLLNCSNGSFAVKWVGDVIVAQTIKITQGTSLNITGAIPGATADGNHQTQLFAVDGASSLHLTDMIVANGDAEFGGAALVLEHSSVSFNGNMTFTGNTALHGGAIFAGSYSAVVWGGDETTFVNNYALYGGAIRVVDSSDVSWHCETAFMNNSAQYYGGAVYLDKFSTVSWSSKTTFTESTAWDGGAIYAGSATVVWHGEDTAFSTNYASDDGGALFADGSSNISWDGVTVFNNNSAEQLGGAVFATESSNIYWSNKTTFTENKALCGGAIYADSSYVVWNAEDITFRNNHAYSEGGAIMAERSSSTYWQGQTGFINNTSVWRGGAVKVDKQSNSSWKGITHFIDNFAHEGGAITASLSSKVSWDGETLFDSNRIERTGGAVHVVSGSKVVWTGNTTFRNNFAEEGAGLVLYDNAVSVWSGTTTFAGNTATDAGGAIDVYKDSSASWTGVTTFTGNTAKRAGSVFVHESEISMDGNTTFSKNAAHLDGGAVIVTVGSTIFVRGTTTFYNNTATAGNAGALGIYGFWSERGSYANISGETTFVNNSAFANGGAIFVSADIQGNYFEEVIFRSNRAGIGGAVATFGTGSGDKLEAKPSVFSSCQFLYNTAAETGGAMETLFGETDIISSHFESNTADVGGALRLSGIVTVSGCSFISNIASSSGLAISVVGIVEMDNSSFSDNVFSCEEGSFLQHVQQESYSTARYDRVCAGCPPLIECDNCTIGDRHLEPTCSRALDHTSADEAGITLEMLRVHRGYWRATAESTTILECYNMAACLGGQTGVRTFCDDGYTGPYCSVCKSGYSPSLSHTCTRCSPSRRHWLVAIAVISVVAAAFAMAVFSAYLVSTNFQDRRSTYVINRILRGVPLQAVKSIVVVWQILTQFASVANITYPGVYQTFLSGVNIINIDVGFVLSAGCLWSDIDFHHRLLASTIWPLAILGFLAMTYAIALQRNSVSSHCVRRNIRNKHVSAALLLFFLVYSSVSSIVFSMFACDSLDDGEEYLRSDYRILCTDPKHRALQVYAAIMIAVYPVGIPLLFAVLLYRHRDVLSDAGADKATTQSIATLWAPYRPNRFYYEIIECARRIMLTGVVVFIYPNDTAQIAITIVSSFLFFALSEVLSPYKSVTDAWLSRSGHVLIFFSMFHVLLLKVDVSQESSKSQQVLAGVFVAVHAVLIVVVVAEAFALCCASRLAGDEVVEEPNPFLSALRVRSKSVKPAGPGEGLKTLKHEGVVGFVHAPSRVVERGHIKISPGD